MTRLHFQHLRETINIGDRYCSPFDYFDWNDASVSDIRNDDTLPHDVGIYGGGKIFGGLSSYAGVRRQKGVLNVAWGVGTVQSFPFSLRYLKSRRLMDLVGSRDFGDKRYTYAPCPSCMSSAFDAPAAPKHEAVFYAHGVKTAKMGIKIPDHIPVLSNECKDLETALEFIGSGATVISNSYHGVYWSLLMGRKPLCIPFSGKFGKYRLAPHYAKASNWQEQITNAVAQPEMLGLARAATYDFKSLVDERIFKHVRT